MNYSILAISVSFKYILYMILYLFSYQAAYERMKQAMRETFELCKQIARALINTVPGISQQFTLSENVSRKRR